MLLRTLATHLRPGNAFSLLVKSNGRKCLQSSANFNGIRNVRLLHQHYKEILCKGKPKRKTILVFLVGPARYAQTAENLREISYKMYKLLMRQCEVHIGLKIRNSIHFYFFYSRIWGEEMAAKVFAGFRKTLIAKTKLIFCSALPLSAIDWHTSGVPDKRFDEALQEYVAVNDLCSATILCEQCLKRKIIDQQIDGIEYCRCQGQLNYTDSSCVFESWTPFIERDNTIVWRKTHDQFKDMYCYKVYGQYDDISANSFAEVQLNTSNRLEWDPTALQLTIEESDPASNNELIYWRVKFPTFFANRDYVYKRRFRVNENRKEIIIVGEAFQHQNHPKISGIHRVEDYWAFMVIRANTDFHVPGMSYTLTYFDNPGTTLPAAITNLIASKSFPDFLGNVHSEAYRLQMKWDAGEDIYQSLPASLRHRRITAPAAAEIDLVAATDTCSGPLIVQTASADSLTEFLSGDRRNAIRVRDAFVDLLQATRPVPPEVHLEQPDGTHFRAQKVQEFVDKLSKQHPSTAWVQKVARLTEKTIKLVEQCAAKKEDSLRIMKEMEKRNHYNYRRHFDDSTQQMLANFFISFNRTLTMDKDLRTGKLLKRPLDPPKPQTRPTGVCPCCAKPAVQDPKSGHRRPKRCSGCHCDTLVSSPTTEGIWETTNLWRSASATDDAVNPVKLDPRPHPPSAWYFYPVFSTWKLLLWLLTPWSAGNT